MVPGVGLEPTRSFDQRILSPLRLPIPPPGPLFLAIPAKIYVDIVSTKQHQSSVIRLKLSRNVYTTITNKTAAEYQPRATEFYIRCEQLAGFWIRVNPSGRKVYGCYGRLFGVGSGSICITRVILVLEFLN